MSGREVESALHLGFVFQPIPETSTVSATSGETSRKRTADEEPAADVPSASRRRRSANPDPSSYIRPTFPTCCVNGVGDQTCLIPASSGFDPIAPSNIFSHVSSLYRPQVIPPHVHAHLAAVPSTSVVHNVSPIAFHVRGPSANYAYFVQNMQNMQANHLVQPLMGVRLPTAPVHYMAQDVPLPEQVYLPPVMGEMPEEYPRVQRPYNFHPLPLQQTPALPSVINTGSEWDHIGSSYRLYSGYPYASRMVNRIDVVPSRIAQTAVQSDIEPVAPANILAAQTHLHPQINYPERWGDLNHSRLPLIDGPVAVPTLAADWVPSQDTENVSALNNPQQFEFAQMGNTEMPFRTWEAAVLHIFDRMAPQSIRLPPKGMTKNEIDQIKSFRISDPILVAEKMCVICQCDFEKRDLVRMLPCAHHFHLKCIDKWLKGNRTCPICRQNAAPEGAESSPGTLTDLAFAAATMNEIDVAVTGVERAVADREIIENDIDMDGVPVRSIAEAGAGSADRFQIIELEEPEAELREEN